MWVAALQQDGEGGCPVSSSSSRIARDYNKAINLWWRWPAGNILCIMKIPESFAGRIILQRGPRLKGRKKEGGGKATVEREIIH